MAHARRTAHASLKLAIFEESPQDGGVLKEREPPTEFRILESGANTALKAPATFLFDEKAAEMVMESFAQCGRGFLNFDYEHGATMSNGEPAPSAGRWVPEVRDGELWATQIKWTPRAARLIATREYELFSPWFTHEEEPPYRITSILNCALTNTPALLNAMPLIAASTATGDHMDPKDKEIAELKAALEEIRATLAAALGERDQLKASLAAAAEEASEEEEEGKKEEVAAALKLKTSLVAVTGKASVAAALGVVEAWKGKAAIADKLQAEVEAQRTAKLSLDFDAVFEKAKESGVAVAAANDIKAKALKFGGGKVTENALDFATAALSIAPTVATKTVREPQASLGLSGSQGEMLSLMNIDPKAFAEYQAKKLAQKAGS
jgi:phage I-like protein